MIKFAGSIDRHVGEEREEEEGEGESVFTLVWWPTVSIESRSFSLEVRSEERRRDRRSIDRSLRCDALPAIVVSV